MTYLGRPRGIAERLADFTASCFLPRVGLLILLAVKSSTLSKTCALNRLRTSSRLTVIQINWFAILTGSACTRHINLGAITGVWRSNHLRPHCESARCTKNLEMVARTARFEALSAMKESQPAKGVPHMGSSAPTAPRMSSSSKWRVPTVSSFIQACHIGSAGVMNSWKNSK